MVNQNLSSFVCGDIKMFSEGVLVYPPDRLDPYRPSPEVSMCVDSTTGRSGEVWIQDGQIHAQIDPGVDPRWPQPTHGANLHVWVSQDGTDAASRELDETRVIGFAGEDLRLYEPANQGGTGRSTIYALPEGYSFAACSIEGFPAL
jgi:hypothetical protein